MQFWDALASAGPYAKDLPRIGLEDSLRSGIAVLRAK